MVICLPKNLGIYKLKYKCTPEDMQDKEFLNFFENDFEDFVKSLHERNIPVILISGELKDNFNESGAYGKLLGIVEGK